MKKVYNCDYRRFDFKRYPKHVKILTNYAFKAAVIQVIYTYWHLKFIINSSGNCRNTSDIWRNRWRGIYSNSNVSSLKPAFNLFTWLFQETLQEFGHIFWVDSSFRLHGNNIVNIDAYVQMNKQRAGITVWPLDFLRQACFIHTGMFNFFGEKAEDFVDSFSVEGGAILIYNYWPTYRAIVLPWLMCAFTEQCISPKGSKLSPCNFENKFTSKHCCHRYDQSAMGLILERVFHFNSSLYFPNLRIHDFERE